MEIHRLKGFVAIVREGNLTRAAERLHLSQSALSTQLRLLEEELGLALFRRTSKGMELTEAGREISHFIDGVLEAADRLKLKAQALGQGGGETVHIGLNADPSFLRIGAINRRLAKLHGELNVIFLTSQTVRTAQLLRQGQLDLAFFYGDSVDADLRHRRLAEVRFCVVIPLPLLPAFGRLDWAEVAALPWVWVGSDSPPYDAMLEQLEQRRLTPSRAVKTVDEHIVKELVVDGQGVAVMREDEARPLARAGRVVIWEKGWMTLPLSLAWLAASEEKKRVRAARAVIEYVWGGSGRHEEESLDRFWY